jgi:hypothetical protein
MKEELLNNRVIMDGIVSAQTELKVCAALGRPQGAPPLMPTPPCLRLQGHMKQYGMMAHDMKET